MKIMIFVNLKWKELKNRIIHISRLEAWRSSVLLFAAVFSMLGLYLLFYRAFNYLNSAPLFGPILIERLFMMVFLISFIMLVFSNIITSFSTLYFSGDLPFLLSSPVRPLLVFSVKLTENIFYSSWMVGIMLTPLLIAYGRIRQANPGYYLYSAVGILWFFLICGLIAVGITMVLMRFFPTKRIRDFFLVIVVVLVGGLFILLRFLQPEKLVNRDEQIVLMQYLAGAKAPVARFLPSYWVSRVIILSIGQKTEQFYFYNGLLISVNLVVFILLLSYLNRHYLKIWANVQGSSGRRQKKEGEDSWEKFKKYLISPFLVKDVKYFFRETSHWSQLLILVALVVIYVFNIYKLPLDLPYLKYLKNFISFLNIGMAGFVLAATALRLVFPTLSIEGGSLWVIKVSPFREKKYLREKFWFSFLPLAVLGTVLILATNFILRVDFIIMLFSFLTVILLVAGLVSLALGLGIYFPEFKADNIAQIESSKGGIFYIIFSFAYIGLILAIESWPLRMYFMWKMGAHLKYPIIVISGSLIIFILANTAAIFLPLYYGKRALEKLEI